MRPNRKHSALTWTTRHRSGVEDETPVTRSKGKQKRIHSGPLLLLMGDEREGCESEGNDFASCTWRSGAIEEMFDSVSCSEV